MATDDTTQAKTPAVSEKPDIDALGVEQGIDAQLPFAAPYNPVNDGTAKTINEELQEVLREQWEDSGPNVRQLVAMRRMDGQARALYRLLTLPIRSALTTSQFLPGDGDKGEADFINSVFNTPPESGGMTVTFHRFMSQMLQGLFDGFAAFEKVFWIPDHGPMQGKITLKKLAYRPSETVTFIADKSGGFAGIRQRAQIAGKSLDVFIPQDRSFYFAAQEEERKFYGVSYFESAFYHYDKKVKMYFIAHLAAQRTAVGTRVGTVPPNATLAARNEFLGSLRNLSAAQYMLMPEGFKVDVLKEAGSFDFLNYINHHNSQMSKSILAQFFDESQGSGPGGSALVNFAQPGDDMFALMLRAIMDDVANQINHYIIPQLIDWNFPNGVYPEFTWGKLTDDQRQAIADTFDRLAAAGQQLTVTPEFMFALEKFSAEQMGLQIDYDAIEERKKQQAAQATLAQTNAAIQQPSVGGGAPPVPGGPQQPGAPAPAGPTYPGGAAPLPVGSNAPTAPAGGGDAAFIADAVSHSQGTLNADNAGPDELQQEDQPDDSGADGNPMDPRVTGAIGGAARKKPKPVALTADEGDEFFDLMKMAENLLDRAVDKDG